MVDCIHAEEKDEMIYGRMTRVYICQKFNGAKCNETFQKRCPYYKEAGNGSRNTAIDTQSTGE